MEEYNGSSSSEDEPVEFLDGTKDTSYMDIEALDTLINCNSDSEYSDVEDEEENENNRQIILDEEYNANINKTPQQSQALKIQEKYAPITTPNGSSSHLNSKAKEQKMKLPELNLVNGEDEDEYDEENEEENKKLYGKVGEGEEQFYNENEDEENEVWIKKHCRINKKIFTLIENNRIIKDTDAVLSCPFCFSILSYECQQHEKYKSQYRAMFVNNCKIIRSEKLYPHEKKKKSDKSDDKDMNEWYYPVHCEVCDADVGVFDKDEVYTFFNVIASYG